MDGLLTDRMREIPGNARGRTSHQHTRPSKGHKVLAGAEASRGSRGREVIVVGGGAAGLTAAYFASRKGAKVTVLESTPETGKKILISGGKRCNVIPGDIEIDRDYVTESSKSALRAIFARWDLWSCKEWLEEEVGLPLALDEKTNKYFPESNSAKQVRDNLLQACTKSGVSVRYGSRLTGLKLENDEWTCLLGNGKAHKAQRVVMATGGQSFPALGTDGVGMRLMESMGHNLHEPYPALTPLRGKHTASSQLAGLSMYGVQLRCSLLPAKAGKAAKAGPIAERSAMLFTHKGFSGPAVLDLSHHLVRAQERQQPIPSLRVNWLSEDRDVWKERIRIRGSLKVGQVLRHQGIPSRLADALVSELQIDDRPTAQLRKQEVESLLDALTNYKLQCHGHEGYAKAEVTGGGVKLNEMDCATLESRKYPGLHMCGEILDVFGRIGGFNFYWAWLSGRIAGIGSAS